MPLKSLKSTPLTTSSQHQNAQTVGNVISLYFYPSLPLRGAVAGGYPIAQQLQQGLAIGFRWIFSIEQI